ncbi:MAG: hypothetical protein GXP16_17470 [Gammaproteobacteria bacterium]|nr:hypothetical protein [Gammaproteobacteria bacterium]
MLDPVTQFTHDRARAWQQKDPMAGLCTVANIDAAGQAQLRTLVLREVEGALAIFVNASSPKWRTLQQACAVHTFWPSVQIQYRLQVETSPVGDDFVASSWQLRPDAPKKMDWFYQLIESQSKPIASRTKLLQQLDQLDLPNPLVAPEQAKGLLLHIMQIERLDLTQPNGVHDRQLFIRQKDEWQQQTLVP